MSEVEQDNQRQRDEAPRDSTPAEVAPGLSRRRFLQAIGATALGAVAASIVVPSHIAVAAKEDAVDLAQAQAIAAESPLSRQALDELRRQGLPFDLSRAALMRPQGLPDWVLLVLDDTLPKPKKIVAHLSLNINVRARILNVAYYSISHGLPTGVEDETVFLFDNGQREEAKRLTRWEDMHTERRDPVGALPGSQPTQAAPATLSAMDYCTPYSYTQCDPSDGSYYYSSCDYTLCCICSAPGVYPYIIHPCGRDQWYKNCRDCTQNSDCSTACGGWWSVWQSRDHSCEEQSGTTVSCHGGC